MAGDRPDWRSAFGKACDEIIRAKTTGTNTMMSTAECPECGREFERLGPSVFVRITVYEHIENAHGKDAYMRWWTLSARKAGNSESDDQAAIQ